MSNDGVDERKNVAIGDKYVILGVLFDAAAADVAGKASQFWIMQQWSETDGYEFDVDMDVMMSIQPVNERQCVVRLPIVFSQTALDIFKDQSYASMDQCNSLFGLAQLAHQNPSELLIDALQPQTVDLD